MIIYVKSLFQFFFKLPLEFGGIDMKYAELLEEMER